MASGFTLVSIESSQPTTDDWGQGLRCFCRGAFGSSCDGNVRHAAAAGCLPAGSCLGFDADGAQESFACTGDAIQEGGPDIAADSGKGCRGADLSEILACALAGKEQPL